MIYFVLIVKTLTERYGTTGNRRPGGPAVVLPGNGAHSAPTAVPGLPPRPQAGRSKAAEYQVAMEKRGRGRERGSAPGSGRRREEEVGVRDVGESARAPGKPGGKSVKKERGITRELSLDLEKGFGMNLKAFS